MEDSVHKSEMTSLEAWYETYDSRVFQGLGMHGFSCKMMALYRAKGWRFVLAQKYKITCLATFLVFEASVINDFLMHDSDLVGWCEALNMFCSGLEAWFVQKE